MPQLHLYVPEDLATEIARRAESLGVSVSKYLADVVKKEVSPGWPPGYFEQVVGSITDETFQRPPQLPLEEREPLD
jgi:hypothetical protein